MSRHSCAVTGMTDRRQPLRTKGMFSSEAWVRSSFRLIVRFNFRPNFTSTRYQRGFCGSLLGSKYLASGL